MIKKKDLWLGHIEAVASNPDPTVLLEPPPVTIPEPEVLTKKKRGRPLKVKEGPLKFLFPNIPIPEILYVLFWKPQNTLNMRDYKIAMFPLAIERDIKKKYYESMGIQCETRTYKIKDRG